MRNEGRIKPFCDQLAEVWKRTFPDWRFGQFMCNFLGWVQGIKNKDPFFPEENEMIEYLHEYEKELAIL